MANQHLFYRTIERNLDKTAEGFVDRRYSVWMDINANSKISELLHMAFDYEEGDNYPWPCDNITKEEIGKLWLAGQRAFILMFGYKEVILYDLKIITQDDYINFMKKEEDVKKTLISKLTKVVHDWSEPELNKEVLEEVSKDIEKIINENNSTTNKCQCS